MLVDEFLELEFHIKYKVKSSHNMPAIANKGECYIFLLRQFCRNCVVGVFISFIESFIDAISWFCYKQQFFAIVL